MTASGKLNEAQYLAPSELSRGRVQRLVPPGDRGPRARRLRVVHRLGLDRRGRSAQRPGRAEQRRRAGGIAVVLFDSASPPMARTSRRQALPSCGKLDRRWECARAGPRRSCSAKATWPTLSSRSDSAAGAPDPVPLTFASACSYPSAAGKGQATNQERDIGEATRRRRLVRGHPGATGRRPASASSARVIDGSVPVATAWRTRVVTSVARQVAPPLNRAELIDEAQRLAGQGDGPARSPGTRPGRPSHPSASPPPVRRVTGNHPAPAEAHAHRLLAPCLASCGYPAPGAARRPPRRPRWRTPAARA